MNLKNQKSESLFWDPMNEMQSNVSKKQWRQTSLWRVICQDSALRRLFATETKFDRELSSLSTIRAKSASFDLTQSRIARQTWFLPLLTNELQFSLT